jgi:hypothetical protein
MNSGAPVQYNVTTRSQATAGQHYRGALALHRHAEARVPEPQLKRLR